MVSVMLRLLYRMIELESSVTIETQLKMAPERMPLLIIGTVIETKVFSLLVPREIEASSMLIGICINVALAERIV